MLSSWYKTDLGYYATRRKLLEQGKKLGIVGDMQDYKGILTFYFADLKDVTFQITSNGKLGIYNAESIRREECLQRLDGLLLRADGKTAHIIETIMESSASAREKMAIVKVAMVTIPVAMPRALTFGFELSLLNNLKTSTIVEEVRIKADGRPINYYSVDERIPAGETRKIPPIPCSSTLLGKTWNKGGKIQLRIIHTHDETSLSLKVPPLRKKRLPYTLFPESR